MSRIDEDIFGTITEDSPCKQAGNAKAHKHKKKAEKAKKEAKRAREKVESLKKKMKKQSKQVQQFQKEARQEIERRHECEVMLAYIRGRFDGLASPDQLSDGGPQIYG